MRGKKAKALRGAAQQLSIGLPQRQLVVVEQRTIKDKHPIAAANNPQSTRAVQQALKRIYLRQGAQGVLAVLKEKDDGE